MLEVGMLAPPPALSRQPKNEVVLRFTEHEAQVLLSVFLSTPHLRSSDEKTIAAKLAEALRAMDRAMR